MKLHFLQHHPEEGLGTIRNWAFQNGFEISCTKLYENNTQFPDDIDFLVIMGGPQSVYEEEKFPWLKTEKAYIKDKIEEKIPVLGICLGAQLIANALSSNVYPNQEKEIGWHAVWFTEQAKSEIIGLKLPHSLEVFHWHGDTFDLPNHAIPLAWSEATQNQGFLIDNHVIALQFHLEMDEASIHGMSETFESELKKGGNYVQSLSQIKSKNELISGNQNLMFRMLDFLKIQIKESKHV
ncbi:MAG: type 1 glutamine amidotransferase [Cytophagales bacterium]